VGRVASDADVFRAVADATRRALLDLLAIQERSATELARPFAMSQPAISQHLGVLKAVGLVNERRVGRQRFYRLQREPLHRVFDWAATHAVRDPSGHVWNLQSESSKGTPAMAIKGARPDTRQISPHLIVRDGQAALRFYQQAFGAEVLYLSEMPSGVGLHAQLRIADSVVLLSSENMQQHPEAHVRAPETLGGTSVLLELYVDDVDAWFQRAVTAGAKPTMQPEEAFFGDRYGWVTDPFGHIWALATVKETLTPEELANRMQAATSGHR
jgi:PhnB protein